MRQDSGSAGSVVNNSTGAVETPEQTLSQQIAAMQATLNQLAAVQAAATPPAPAPVDVVAEPTAPGEFASADVQTPAADAAAAAQDRKIGGAVNRIEQVALKIASESGAELDDIRKVLDEVQQVRALGPGQAVQLPGVPLDEFGVKYTLSLTIKREG